MMKVKIKTSDHSFTIPVPYTLLHMGSGILTSRIVHRKMMKWLRLDSRQRHHLESNPGNRLETISNSSTDIAHGRHFHRAADRSVEQHVVQSALRSSEKRDVQHYNSGLDAAQFGKELLVSILQDRSTKREFKKLIKVIQSCRGTVLVNVRTHDGTSVIIKL